MSEGEADRNPFRGSTNWGSGTPVPKSTEIIASVNCWPSSTLRGPSLTCLLCNHPKFVSVFTSTCPPSLRHPQPLMCSSNPNNPNKKIHLIISYVSEKETTSAFGPALPTFLNPHGSHPRGGGSRFSDNYGVILYGTVWHNHEFCGRKAHTTRPSRLADGWACPLTRLPIDSCATPSTNPSLSS